MKSWKSMQPTYRTFWLTVPVVLAILFLVTLLSGLGGVTVIQANADTLFVDGASGSDPANNCQNPASPCATIGQALSQSMNGDTILVAEETYTETLSIGISVTLKGGYEAVGWTQDIAANPTIVDGSGAADSVFNIAPDTVVTLEGFIVQGGNATDEGGGFFINGATVVISGTVIQNNEAGSSGGGIWVEGEGGSFDVTIANSSLVTNTAGGEGGGLGGCCAETGNLVTLNNVDIRGNTAQGDGGGLDIRSKVIISSSRIVSNTAGASGGGIQGTDVSIYNSEISENEANGSGVIFGGGVRALERLLLQNSLVGNNQAVGTDESIGGGIAAENVEATIIDIVIKENEAEFNAGVSMFNTVFTMTNSLIVSNTGTGFGGDPITGTLMNVTVADNADDGVSLGGDVSITNSILWGNGGDDYNCPAGCTLSYSNVGVGNLAGTGNISADPLFVGGGDYHLQNGSPAVDKGTNVGAPNRDYEGDPRPIDGDLDGEAITDMGADEFRPELVFVPILLKS